MNRRELLKLIGLGVANHTLDLDKLLWIPGQKTIFLPSAKGISASQIVALEFEKIIPRIRELFERDDIFYRHIKNSSIEIESKRKMNIPLVIK